VQERESEREREWKTNKSLMFHISRMNNAGDFLCHLYLLNRREQRNTERERKREEEIKKERRRDGKKESKIYRVKDRKRGREKMLINIKGFIAI
jgi:hypothetical protein